MRIVINDDNYFLFEKLRRNRKRYDPIDKIFTREEIKLMNSQVFGSIHTIDDSKIYGFHKNDFYSRSKIRPGVVSFSPSSETNFETEWIPMSTKIKNRNSEEVVFLEKYIESVMEDSVILLRYRGWYKFRTLSHRKGKLSDAKRNELRIKLEKLKSEEIP
jgi:hypothetical protein